MNIDELMTNIGNVNFDSMTQQEMLDYYQELLDANGELQVRLTDLQETNPKPSQEEFDNVKANMETINSEIERVSDAIQKNAEVQDVEEDFTEINDNDNQLEELERQLNENKKRLEKFDSIVNRNGTSHFKSNRTTRELYERKIKELEREIEEINKLKNEAKEQKEDNSNEIENQINNLEEKLKVCAQRMQEARAEGNEQIYAEQRSWYSHLVEEINKLKNQTEEKKENNFTDKPKSLEDRIKELEEKLNENAKVLDEAFRSGDKETEKRSRIERKDLFDRLMNLKHQQSANMNQTKAQKKDNTNEIENQINDLEEKLKVCAQRMQEARAEGNEQIYAEQRSWYSHLVEEINKLKNQTEEKKENNFTDKPKSLEDRIKELEEKLNENAKVLDEAFRSGDKETEKRSRIERKDLFDRLMNLKHQQSANMNQTKQQTNTTGGKNDSDGTDSSGDSNNGNSEENDKDMDEEELNLDENDKDEENDNEKTDEEKKEERKQKIKKAAIGVLGGAIGFGLSFALQPGTAGTVISVGRLVYSTAKKGLKVYTEKHKDDENNKIIKMVGKVKEFTKEQAEKHPKITSAISKVNNFLKKPETQVFLNGMAAGYTIGKISQAVYKMHEASAMEKKVPTNPEVDKTEPEMMKDVPDIDGTPAPNPTPTPVVTDPTPTFDPTKPVDLSSLGEGYVSSYSSDPVSLITSAGKNAMFDKINVVDGKTWVHFTQGNGAGYAWFPADEVLNALDLSDISELTGEVSGGMHL